MKSDKQKIRTQVQKKWNALSKEEIKKLSKKAVEKILQDEKVKKAKVIFSYKALKDELLLGELLEKAGKKIIYCKQSGEVKFPVEPSEGAVIIVPARALAKNGVRLGRGGGHFDKFLAGKNFYTISAVPSFAFFDRLPEQIYDVRIKKVFKVY